MTLQAEKLRTEGTECLILRKSRQPAAASNGSVTMEFLRVLRSESDRDTRNLLIVAVFSGILGILLVALIVGAAQKVSPGQLDTVSLVTFIFCLVAYGTDLAKEQRSD